MGGVLLKEGVRIVETGEGFDGRFPFLGKR